MAIVKKRNEEIVSAFLLESTESVELPPAQIDESCVSVQFEQYKLFIGELVDVLRAGTVAENVPVIKDGATFQVHGATRTFWIKIWHKDDSERGVFERVQVLNSLPLMRNVKILLKPTT
jgi:hypothetical protein